MLGNRSVNITEKTEQSTLMETAPEMSAHDGGKLRTSSLNPKGEYFALLELGNLCIFDIN
jgi:hypothetical protein